MTTEQTTKYDRIVALACRQVHLIPRPYHVIHTVKRGVWLELDVLPEESAIRRIVCLYDIGHVIDIHVDKIVERQQEEIRKQIVLDLYRDEFAFLRDDIKQRRDFLNEWSNCTIDQLATMDDAILVHDYNWVPLENMIPRAEWPAIKRAILEERPGECTMFQTRDYNIYIHQWSIQVQRNDSSAFICVRPLLDTSADETMPLTAPFWRDQEDIDQLVRDSQKCRWLPRLHLLARVE